MLRRDPATVRRHRVRRAVAAASRLCWHVARGGFLVAAGLVIVGGALAAVAARTPPAPGEPAVRPASNAAVVAGFAVLLPSLGLAWLGLPAAARRPDPARRPSTVHVPRHRKTRTPFEPQEPQEGSS